LTLSVISWDNSIKVPSNSNRHIIESYHDQYSWKRFKRASKRCCKQFRSSSWKSVDCWFTVVAWWFAESRPKFGLTRRQPWASDFIHHPTPTQTRLDVKCTRFYLTIESTSERGFTMSLGNWPTWKSSIPRKYPHSSFEYEGTKRRFTSRRFYVYFFVYFLSKLLTPSFPRSWRGKICKSQSNSLHE